MEAVGAWVAQHTREEVVALLQGYQVPAAPLRDVKEVLNDPHLHARGFLTMMDTPSGPMALPNSPIRYGASPLRTLTRPPELGEHTDQVLGELCGFDAAKLDGLRRDGITL